MMNFVKLDIKNKKITISDWNIPAAFFGMVVGIFLYIFFIPNNISDDEKVIFEIPRGSSFNKVTQVLYEKNIIPNKINFRLAAFLVGAGNKLKAGRYEIPSSINYFSLVDYLIEGGHNEQILITIPEGIWQHDLAHLLKQKLDIDSLTFMKLSSNKYFLKKIGIESSTSEGYLLPETYYFYKDSKPDEIIEKLYSEMNKYFDEAAEKRMKELKLNKNQILTLASIIEGESNISSEYKRISGVYHNRLKKWMRLEADPTIQYLKRHRKHNRILYKDLEIDSPYNTYINYGLPPTPINNPGKEAVLAALYPEKNDYLYFVADGTGAHKFAKSFSEHQNNVNNYRKWRSNQ